MAHSSDWFEIEEIGDGCLQITEGRPVLPCNMLLVRDGGEGVLVDTGLGIAGLEELVRELAGPTVRVLLTHSHWDHIGGANQFDDVAIHDRERGADGSVAIDTLSEEFLDRPGQFMQEFRASDGALPAGFDPEVYEIGPVEGVDQLVAGQTISVGERTLELVSVPGHSPGQLAVLDRHAGVCHAADVLEPGGAIFAQFRDAELEAYRETIARLIALRDAGAYDTMTTGHGDPLRGAELGVLDDVAVALRRVLEGAAKYELVEGHWGTIRQYTVGGVEVLRPNA